MTSHSPRLLGDRACAADEIYQIRDFDVRGSKVALRLDPASVDLTRPEVHPQWPLAWTRSHGASATKRGAGGTPGSPHAQRCAVGCREAGEGPVT
jgi:hypothetical protein